ncbi:putative WD-40 repeat protein [Actinacidiphila reveromycinica]|uniref:Putative WD-40 repeat protein n=1 Tax=Actinacidiphila reveromycinica TaxID=659352 RepID=A0A7U3V0B4_9ACTN|nr:hypothetical protein [Streptomyces sp. SN-593]BBB02023.1 putative WD-40 repeat protein [Streptomyces sp. SN-593]
MPRPEGPLDDDGSALTQLAAGLRQLRQQAGTPPYRQLARHAHYSSTTLADAAAGRRLPSLAVTLAYVRACGGDAAEWKERWHRAAAETATAETTQPPPSHTAAGQGRDCPYFGLATFQPEDAEWFFGREELTADLEARIHAHRFLAVFGASGTGKSSLLRAGLLPRLGGTTAGTPPAARPADWRTVLMVPGPHPLEECAARLGALGSGPAAAVHAELLRDPRALHLTALHLTAGDRPGAELLLVVDQFEEVFTLCTDPSERAAFIAALVTAAGAANSRTRVVLGVRADFYARCAEHPELVAALRDAQLLVGPMTTDELRRAVTGPATRAGCTVEGALLARLVGDAAGQPNVLPLMSHALRETWRRRRGTTLTENGYLAAGGLRQALAQSAETVYRTLTPRQAATARSVLLQLIALGDGTEDTRRRVPRADLATDPGAGAVLDVLADARLLTLDATTVEITHEALIGAWPRLSGWIAEDRAGLLVHQQLNEATAVWERERRDPGTLLRGARLTEAAEWAGRQRSLPLGDRARAFLTASVRHHRRTARLRRAAVSTLAVLALLATGTAVWAAQQRSTARSERVQAVAEQLLAQAGQTRAIDPSLAAELDLASYRTRPSREAATGLIDSQNVPLSTPLTGHTQAVYAVAFSPDGHTLATGAGDDTIRLWDLTDPGHPTALGQPLRGHTNWVYWLQFSPDGRTLASASRDRTARLWNVTDPTHPKPWGPPLTGHTGYVFSVSFSGDGRTLVTASYDHTLRLWDVSDPAHPQPLGAPLTGHAGSVASAAFSPDGRTVASAGHDHTIRLWNVTAPGHPLWAAPLTGHSAAVYAVAFSPDGRTLASVSDDRTVRLWDVADPAHPHSLGRPLTGHTNTLLAVAFSPDGRTLATGGADHTIRLWDVTDPAHATQLGQPLLGHTGFVNWLAFSPDGRTLASASDDHTVRLWSLPRTAMTGHTDTVNAIAYAPDGRTLASAAGDGTVRLWNLTDPAQPHPWGPPLDTRAGAATRVAFSPDGRTLAALSDDHAVRLWDVADPAAPRLLGKLAVGGTDSVDALAFAPRGALLATGDSGNRLRLWDVADPTRPAAVGPVLTGGISTVVWAGFSPDGRLLADTSYDDKVRLWDMADPAHPRPLPSIATGDTGGLLGAAFAPDGNALATAGVGHTVQLWDLRRPARPEPLGQPLIGHTEAVDSVAFSPDGRTLASAGDDRTIRLWDVSAPARAVPVRTAMTAGHTGPVTAVAYSPDGHTLASAGADHTVQTSALDVGQAVTRVCATTRDTLTPQQWRQDVPEAGYQAPCGR